MLGFFRKHQRIFFIIVTVVVVISFSFFGTYSAMTSDTARDMIAFKAVDGTRISYSELDEMVRFLASDTEDKQQLGGMWGPNFLNDGVIRNDLLASGLATLLVASYQEPLKDDLDSRLEKEKRFPLYAHPQIPFLKVETIWEYFAPSIKTNLEALRKLPNNSDPEAFAIRSRLYLAEQKFPSPLLRQVLRYQEQQASWITPDPYLARQDLALFGYHTLDDWFGPRFLQLASQFIINSAIIAQEKGYSVSKTEALADLLRNSESSFQQNSKNPHLGVANSKQYLAEQLRRLQLSEADAVSIWQKVLLFRRLFNDAGSSAFVDSLTYQKFMAYANTTTDISLYQLPQGYHLSDYRGLQKFEIYLECVAQNYPSKKKGTLLALPEKFLEISVLKKNYPELVQKRYLLDIAKVNKSGLELKVSLKEMWNWELDESNWSVLQNKFPELKKAPSQLREERLAALDGLENKIRTQVDALARASIVSGHPEWLIDALQATPAETAVVALRYKGGKTPVTGLIDREAFMRLLDAAPLAQETATSAESINAAKQLSQFSADDKTVYRIQVRERSPSDEILTFVEASQDDTLDLLVDQKLEALYETVRNQSPQQFKKENGSWKPLREVRDQIANRRFDELQKAIYADFLATANHPLPVPEMTGDFCAARRFYSFIRGVQAQAQTNPDVVPLASNSEESTTKQKLSPRSPLRDQWKLERAAQQILRKNQAPSSNEEMFAMSEQAWSRIYAPDDGALYFFQVLKKTENNESVAAKASEGQYLLSSEVRRHLMNDLLKTIRDKQAISFMKPKEDKESLPGDS